MSAKKPLSTVFSLVKGLPAFLLQVYNEDEVCRNLVGQLNLAASDETQVEFCL